MNDTAQTLGPSAADMGRTAIHTVRGVMNIFPKDISRGEDGVGSFNPGARAVVYPTAPIARKYGDRRAPQRAVEFDLGPDEFFSVQRYTERTGPGSTAVSVGSFIDYNDAYAALIERVPAGNRAEIRIMVPTQTEVFATGLDGEDVIIGESLTWQPQPIADRLRLTDTTR
jgi:hypothetical protein